MVIHELREILRELPGNLKVELYINEGNDGEKRLRTITRTTDSLLLCDCNENVSSTEIVLYDATPEPRMD